MRDLNPRVCGLYVGKLPSALMFCGDLSVISLFDYGSKCHAEFYNMRIKLLAFCKALNRLDPKPNVHDELIRTGRLANQASTALVYTVFLYS